MKLKRMVSLVMTICMLLTLTSFAVAAEAPASLVNAEEAKESLANDGFTWETLYAAHTTLEQAIEDVESFARRCRERWI